MASYTVATGGRGDCHWVCNPCAMDMVKDGRSGAATFNKIVEQKKVNGKTHQRGEQWPRISFLTARPLPREVTAMVVGF